jgi:hypothetical protein
MESMQRLQVYKFWLWMRACPTKQERFEANFIPHDPGRHRVDVKFNGEKVPNSPWFVEVKVRT